jgi:hypothetical protein
MVSRHGLYHEEKQLWRGFEAIENVDGYLWR